MMFSVLIPALNEEEILRSTIVTLHQFVSTHPILATHEFEAIIVSNGSTDATVSIGRSLAKKYPWLRLYVLDERGVGAAFVKGVKHANGEIIISLDADLSFDLSFIADALEVFKAPAVAMVIGSKSLGVQRRSLARMLASKLYISFAKALFALEVTDYSPGCKAFRTSSIVPALPHLDKKSGYVLELCLYLKKTRELIAEVAVNCLDYRKSHFNLLAEGIHRFSHLFKCLRLTRDGTSWLAEQEIRG